MKGELWDRFRLLTEARIGLGRSGSALKTDDWLKFQMAHAQAKDAVRSSWDEISFQRLLENEGYSSLLLSSEVRSKEEFLGRPDLGRRLSLPSRKLLLSLSPREVVFLVSPGLSSLAVDRHFLGVWDVFWPAWKKEFPELSTEMFLCPYGRVALGDEVGGTLGSRMSVVFVGERPGLSVPDSLGIYLTYNPRPGTADSQRNCISSIRPPRGLGYEVAAQKLLFLMRESLRRLLSGVGLSEESFVSEVFLESQK